MPQPADPSRSTDPDVEERVLDRVRKLLARAEHPATPPAEAEACSEKAAVLMSRYVIDQALLDATAAGEVRPEVRRVAIPAPYAVPKAVLLDGVATAFRCRAALTRDPKSGGQVCVLVGFPADLEAAEVLFTSLLLQSSAAMTAAAGGRGDLRAFRRAFLFGYATTVRDRLAELRRDAESEARAEQPGSALVLADRTGAVQAAFQAEFPRLRTLRATVSSGGGLAAGRAAGAEADLAPPGRRVSGRRRALAG